MAVGEWPMCPPYWSIPIPCGKKDVPSWMSLMPAALCMSASTLIPTHRAIPASQQLGNMNCAFSPTDDKLRPSSDKDFTPRPQELTQGCPSLSIPCPGSLSPGLILKLALGRVHPGSWQPPLHSLASSLGYSPKLSATIHLSLLFLSQMTHKMK